MDQTTRRRAHGLGAWRATALLLCIAACTGRIGGGGLGGDGSSPGGETTGKVATPAAPARRLSNRELRNTIVDLTGLEPAALTALPPDARDDIFDRVYQSQTVSALQLEAYAAISRELLTTVITEKRLDDLATSCSDDILPPPSPSRTVERKGIALVGGPDWDLCNPNFPYDCSESIWFVYAADAFVSELYDFADSGRYRITLSVESNATPVVAASIDDVSMQSFTVNGAMELTYETDIEAGAHSLRWDISGIDSTVFYVHGARIEGPLDLGAEQHAAARQTCTDQIVSDFAARVFRRPLAAAEQQALHDLYAAGLEAGGFWFGLRALFDGLFQSPKFLYLIEQGSEASGQVELTAWELASRLSYALCERPPDDALRQAASDDSLLDPAVLANFAQALLDAPCGRETASRFYQQWLFLDRLLDQARDPAVYPNFTAELRAAMLDDSLTYLSELTFAERVTLSSLFDSSSAFVSQQTADLWGVSSSAADPVKVDLPPERAGLLTHPALLAVTSKFDSTSPVFRGAFVLRNLLCEELPPPSKDIDVTPPEFDPTKTTRERFAAHTDSPACAPCHERIDPVGFSLENFDAIGRYRSEENGLPIDSSGGVPSIGIADGSLHGGAELSRAIAKSAELSRCFARGWWRFALGRYETPDEDAAGMIQTVADDASLTSVVDALQALVESPAFMLRRRP